jgi:hypothetical protein
VQKLKTAEVHNKKMDENIAENVAIVKHSPFI